MFNKILGTMLLISLVMFFTVLSFDGINWLLRQDNLFYNILSAFGIIAVLVFDIKIAKWWMDKNFGEDLIKEKE